MLTIRPFLSVSRWLWSIQRTRHATFPENKSAMGNRRSGWLSPLFFFIWFGFGHHIENIIHQRKFNAHLWKADVWNKETKRQVYVGNWPPRLCMVDDLMAGRCLLGMTKSQVIELLGPPDRLYHFSFEYYLGPERGFIRIDSEALVVDFDLKAKASRMRIYRD